MMFCQSSSVWCQSGVLPPLRCRRWRRRCRAGRTRRRRCRPRTSSRRSHGRRPGRRRSVDPAASTSSTVSREVRGRGHRDTATVSIGLQMSTAMMSAPSSASRTAWLRPCPRAAPVMKATLPSTRPVMCTTAGIDSHPRTVDVGLSSADDRSTSHSREALEDLVERDAALEAGQRVAEAEVGADAEGQVLAAVRGGCRTSRRRARTGGGRGWRHRSSIIITLPAGTVWP